MQKWVSVNVNVNVNVSDSKAGVAPQVGVLPRGCRQGVRAMSDSAAPTLDFGVRIPLIELLGMTLHHMAEGTSEMRYEAREEHLNSFGVTHGGALMTLLDVTMATAARSETPQLGVVTIEMKTSFMRPASGRLRAVGKVVHRTPTMAFTEARVFDARGQVCSQATGTFKYVRRLPGTGRTLHGLQRSQEPQEHTPPAGEA